MPEWEERREVNVTLELYSCPDPVTMLTFTPLPEVTTPPDPVQRWVTCRAVSTAGSTVVMHVRVSGSAV